MCQNAKHLFGIEDGLVMTHAVDDRGVHCGYATLGGFIDFACGAWMGKFYWQYYEFTGDKTFLAERALPFLRGIMRGYECALRKEGDALVLPISISAEYARIRYQDGRMVRQYIWKNPSWQLAAVHMLVDILLQACDILKIEPSPIWTDIKRRVPRYSLITEGGESRIGIAQGQDLEVCHRHHSHLARGASIRDLRL